MNKYENYIERTKKAIINTIAYCSIWMLLEILLYGELQPRLVDDIMMILFIPMIYKATNGTWQ
jgi:hypothetical protein